MPEAPIKLLPPIKLEPPRKPIRKQFYPLLKGMFFGLVFAGLFSGVLYVFADPPEDKYDFDETLNPSCAPGTTNCSVVSPAAYSFGSNNFSGTGGFTTTGAGSFGSMTLTTDSLAVGSGGTGLSIIAAGSILGADTLNILSAITSTSGTKILTNTNGTITWETNSGGSMVYPSGSGIPIVSGGTSWGSTITDNHANWDTAYTDRLKWDGGATGLDAATGRVSLGLVIGTNVQAYNATLASLAGLANSSGVLTNNGTGTLSWVAGGSGVSLGTTTQIPYTNSGGTDFLYSSNFTYNGNTLNLISTSTVQEKLSYNGSIYTTLAVASDGTLTVANTGGATGDIVLQPTGTGDVALLSDTGKMALGGNGNTNNENLTFDFESSNDLVWIASTTGVSNIAWTGNITMGGATAGTLVTRTKAGAPNEADPVGSIVVDTIDNAIYFKTATGTWHYAATGGFQIPDYEKTDPISGDQIKEGDIVMGMTDKTMPGNNALHGVWVKWDSVKAQLLAEARGELSKTGTLGSGSVAGVQTETLLGKVTNVLASLGISVKDGVAQITQLAVKKLSAKNARVETLEMVDKATGKIYCTWLENGQIMKAKGQCETVDVSTAKSQIVNQVTLEAQKTAKKVAQQILQQSDRQSAQELQDKIKKQVQQEVQQQLEQLEQQKPAPPSTPTPPAGSNDLGWLDQKQISSSGTMIKNAAAGLIKSTWEFTKWIFGAIFFLPSKLMPSAILLPFQEILGR